MLFGEFRENGMRTYYEAIHRPWEADMITSGLIFCFVITAISSYVVVFSRDKKQSLFAFLKVTGILSTGAVILITNFAMTWETAETTVRTKYKAGTGAEVNVTIGVHIGLRGVNITLKGDKDQIEGETIDYNEHFSWVGLQGRIGFGPQAGQFNQDYRAAQARGLPLPILWVAEYFTLDGEGIRWGRFYRQAGWYAHIMLWLAVPLWILASVSLFILLRYGAYGMCLTGLSMIIANIVWKYHRNPMELTIRFTEHKALEFSKGTSFYLCFITGILIIVEGIIIFILDKKCPEIITSFFGVDILQDSEQIQVEDESIHTVVNTRDRPSTMNFADDYEDQGCNTTNTRSSDQIVEKTDDDDDDIYCEPQAPMRNNDPQARPKTRMDTIRIPFYTKKSFKSPETRFTKVFQRQRRRDCQPNPSHYYSNVSFSLSHDIEMSPSPSDYSTASGLVMRRDNEMTASHSSLHSNYM